MDTVSMLNTMRFYCQPILPLVYDESMSYYETLCKVVGQLNTTGETVNKLNEGLTGEISDRQAADAALDARIKEIEETNGKIHFLVFADANPSGAMPTRSELYNWVRNGDAIYTLFSTNESGRGKVYAASCTYNAGNWGSEASNDFNIIVPIETSYDAANDYAIRQKIAKLTIPSVSQASLNAPWGLQIIEINTPSTTSEGVVNFIATVNDSGAVNASLTPSEFLQLYNMTRGGKNLCVAVNAKLVYDGLARASSIATVDTTNRIARIAFERDYGTAITNGVNQLNKTFDYIIGDAKTGTWVHETIDSKIFDFSRYEGFQFTRGANNVITTDDESTPNAVYAQYHSNTSGKLYQNLPTRLIDTVDGAEYWNGTFDIYGGNHMTFTFVTSNYATASDKMLVRVIELSADVGTTAWKYGVKEFTLPLDTSDKVVIYTASKVGEGEYSAAKHKIEYTVDFAEGVPAIIASIEAGNRVILRVDLKELGSESGTTPLYFASGYTRVDVFANAISYIFSGSISNGHYTLEVNSALAQATLTDYGEVLPEPNPDGSDNGKVPTINGTAWELKTPSGGGSTFVDDGTGNISVDGATAQSANRFLQSLTFPDLNYKYLNPMNSGTYSDPYGVKVGAGASLIETVLAMTNPGVYTVYMHRSATDVPAAAAAASSSLRGLMILSQINKHYAIVMLVDQLSNFYVQYIQNDVGGGWKQMPDSSAAANAVLYTAQTLTSPQQAQARKNIGALGSVSPNIKSFMIITPQNEADGIGVALSARGTGGNFTLDIADANEGNPTKLMGVKTPSDAETHAAANVEYVKAKVAGASGGTVDTAMSDTSTNAVQNKVIKKYVDDNRNQMTNAKLFGVTMFGSDASKPNLGVQLEVEATGSDAAINLLNLYGGEGTKLTGIATPGYADNDSAATVAFALHNSFVVVDTEEVKNYDYQGILEEINRGTCNIWLDVNQQKIRANSYKVTGSGAYQLIFIGSSDGSAIDVHSVTVSASAAEYAITTK